MKRQLSLDLKDKKELWIKTGHRREVIPISPAFFCLWVYKTPQTWAEPSCSFQGLQVHCAAATWEGVGEENPRKPLARAPTSPSL